MILSLTFYNEMHIKSIALKFFLIFLASCFVEIIKTLLNFLITYLSRFFRTSLNNERSSNLVKKPETPRFRYPTLLHQILFSLATTLHC